MPELTPEMIARNYIERLVICAALEKASNEDIEAFEQTHTPMEKYVGYGCYTFNSAADEDRACNYAHTHFLLDRCLTLCARMLLAAGIDLGEFSDFDLHIKEQVAEKLEIIARGPKL